MLTGGDGVIHHVNLLLILGIAVVGGTAGAKLFQRLRVPQVVGYIVIGLIIGQGGLGIVSGYTIDSFEPLTYFALGIIGFMIGGELKFGLFRQFGRQFASILLAEGLAAFVVVGAGATAVTYMCTGDIRVAAAMGVVLGAISSATDPATTIQVLWEYKTRGPVTTAATAVVALDDVLALTLYAIGTSVAAALTGRGSGGLGEAVANASYEIGVSLGVGFAAGLLLAWLLLRVEQSQTVLVLVTGAVLLVLGVSVAFELDIILSSMAMGLTLANTRPRMTEKAFELMKQLAPPVYVLFFVLVGARMRLDAMSLLAWVLVAVYVVGRSTGKIGGCYVGAVLSKARQTVRKYLGLCLFAQGGVAIGLSIVASHRFDSGISSTVVLVVTATTLVLQLAGPVFVKVGVKRAEEVGLNITEEDLIKSYTVREMMDSSCPVVAEDAPVAEIIRIVSETDNTFYPVVDDKGNLVGSITMEGIRKTFATQELGNWLVAVDIMEPVAARTRADEALGEALAEAAKLGVQDVAVVEPDDGRFAGVLNIPMVHRRLGAEVLARQQKADAMATT